MKRLILPLLGTLAGPSAALAQACYPTKVSFGWTQPNNVPITDDSADRWPTDATIRLAYGGSWCPEDAQFELKKKDGGAIAAQVRFVTPSTVVENTAQALTVIDIDPEQPLEPRADYQLTVRPPQPVAARFCRVLHGVSGRRLAHGAHQRERLRGHPHGGARRRHVWQ